MFKERRDMSERWTPIERKEYREEVKKEFDKPIYRPLEPLEPRPYELNAKEWELYVAKRDAARAFAKENDLRGTF